jgi:ParB family chromosome partitioning protein
VQDLVLDNKLSMGHARILSKMENNDEINELADKIVNENISVRTLETMTSTPEVKKKLPVRREQKSTNYSYVESELKDTLGTKVKISDKKIEIYFENNNDLDRILEIMNVKIK